MVPSAATRPTYPPVPPRLKLVCRVPSPSGVLVESAKTIREPLAAIVVPAGNCQAVGAAALSVRYIPASDTAAAVGL